MTLVWTKRVQRNFDDIASYLRSEWGERVEVEFIREARHTVALIQRFPHAGQVLEGSHGIRGLSIVRQVRLYYRIKGEVIIVLTLFDTRQDPKRLPK